MEFIIGVFLGALIMAAAVAVSITYEPYAKIVEYRLELGLEDENEEQR
ncbi:MAG TPA: hypothetical protein PLS20_08340 [Ruminococcus flavefaciens]|nr:hypothetical protein [Ruminococcus flavefaciens]